jgi:hypothetical protein
MSWLTIPSTVAYLNVQSGHDDGGGSSSGSFGV